MHVLLETLYITRRYVISQERTTFEVVGDHVFVGPLQCSLKYDEISKQNYLYLELQTHQKDERKHEIPTRIGEWNRWRCMSYYNANLYPYLAILKTQCKKLNIC